MPKIPDLRETPDLSEEIKGAALNGDLVLFVGAGASMLVGLPSWAGLALGALNELLEDDLINYAELEQLKTLDPKKQLSIAKQIAEANTYTLDLVKLLKFTGSDKGIYKYLDEIGCVCVTTNYDELLEPKYLEIKDGSTPPAPVNRVFKKEEFYPTHLDSPGSVIHLHGSVSDPASMIVTTKDYLEHYDDDMVQVFLGRLFERKTVLFLGYGLEEAEILEHILRRGSARKISERMRFNLQGFFGGQQPLYEKLYDYYESSFGVHLIGFVKDFKGHYQLESIIKSWVGEIEVKAPALAEDMELMREVLGDE